jgi:outer membrane protein OmpA-like peptidoglycan-associated protein
MPVDQVVLTRERPARMLGAQRSKLARPGRAGLLPRVCALMLAAYALWPFAFGEIESEVEAELRKQLNAQGHGWADLRVSGQHVWLSGTPPTAGAGDAALALARQADCPTWLGRQTCAVQVLGLFAALPPAAAVVPPRADGSASASMPSPAPARHACEREMAALVARSRIEFATDSADIEPGSTEVLNQLARAASGCPGVIQISGHSDSTGEPQANLALSLARAEAVRQALIERGLQPQRLLSRGFGESQPLVDNSTAAGRALNRRIEFRLMPGP